MRDLGEGVHAERIDGGWGSRFLYEEVLVCGGWVGGVWRAMGMADAERGIVLSSCLQEFRFKHKF